MLTPHIFIVAMEENLQEKVCKKKKRMQDYNHWVQRGVFKGVCKKGVCTKGCEFKDVCIKGCV
jgi:CRISPR/Cas system-associated endoribonuclease Cas2